MAKRSIGKKTEKTQQEKMGRVVSGTVVCAG